MNRGIHFGAEGSRYVPTVETVAEAEPIIARPRIKPELLAPAGDRTCLIAAIENGADAVYFGLHGHNARARAANFDVDELPEIMGLLHQRGVRGYVTLNTLVFPAELDAVEALVRRIAASGVDAVIIQDLGLARLIRAITPDLEMHASTQMSISSVEGIRLARDLGCSRVILARELSIQELARIQAESPLPVEVFVHGALCVAYSGQCLTSESLGGRSANRGECAQACRMPYEVVSDGEKVDLGNVQYLLSPQDLAAFDVIPRLVELGVRSLKIEGRLKSPAYVANITRNYRKAIDAAWAGQSAEFSAGEVQDMEMSFSRGFSHGFLDGNNHKVLVRGDYAKKRGIFVGTVRQVTRDRVVVELAAPIKAGDGVVFDGDDASNLPEQGGRVYEVSRPTRAASSRGNTPCESSFSAGVVELAFGRRDLDTNQLRPGQRIWKTDDPELTRRLRASFEGNPHRLVDLNIHVKAVTGQALSLAGTTSTGLHASVSSDERLAAANQAASPELLREQLGRLGGTVYRLTGLEAEIEGGPMMPKSLLNSLRRELVGQLDAMAAAAPARAIAEAAVLPVLRASLRSSEPNAPTEPGPPALSALCRTTDQAAAAVEAGVRTIYLDFQDIKLYRDAVAATRSLAADLAVFIATPRIQKPGEAAIFQYLTKQGADGMLVRNAGGLEYCMSRGVPFVVDYSLNAANELTVEWLKARGALRVTASYDLSFEQLDDLTAAAPPRWLEIVVHQHMPMFHMEHCVFCAFLSPGTDKTNCGRPCDLHDVKLRDRVGMEHPLKADVGCRNTLYNAVPQTAAEYLPRLVAKGVQHLRVEFLDDKPSAARRTLELYGDAVAGRRNAKNLWRELKATNQYGVTRGQLAVLQY
jgi:U32 family peptidase